MQFIIHRLSIKYPVSHFLVQADIGQASCTGKKLIALIIDIEKYQQHPDCEKIYCFVYDPDTILRNPAAIKKDLEEKHKGLVKVFIES